MTPRRPRWLQLVSLAAFAQACTGANPDLALSSGGKTADADVMGDAAGGTPTGGIGGPIGGPHPPLA